MSSQLYYFILIFFLLRFPVNVKTIRWEEYIKIYVSGIRQFILRDEITSMDKAKQKLAKYVPQ
jgi:hypothetical protein